MSTDRIQTFEHTRQLSEEWVDQVAAEMQTDDRQRAYAALRAVTHALRDRLMPTEASHLAAQMPMLIRGMYYEGWHPAGKPDTMRTLDEFLGRIREELANSNVDEAHAARCVFTVLRDRISDGEIDDVVGTLPAPIRELWPAAVAG